MAGKSQSLKKASAAEGASLLRPQSPSSDQDRTLLGRDTGNRRHHTQNGDQSALEPDLRVEQPYESWRTRRDSTSSASSLRSVDSATLMNGGQNDSNASKPTLAGRSYGWCMGVWGRERGVIMVLGSFLFAVLMNISTQVLEITGNEGKGMSPIQILFVRFAITSLLSTLYMWIKKIDGFPFGAKEVRLLLFIRGLAGFVGVFCLYYSLMYLPLADATVITFLAPFTTGVLCTIFIKQPYTRTEILGALISLVGVILIARPTFLFPDQSTSDPTTTPDNDTPPLSSSLPSNITASPLSDHHGNNPNDVTPQQRATAVVVALLGLFGASTAYTVIRMIGHRAHPLMLVNYYGVVCALLSALSLLIFPSVSFVLPANLREWSLLLALGFCGFVMQYLLNAGMAVERSSRATNMIYVQMIFALVLDAAVWGIVPGLLSVVGSVLILASAIWVAVWKDGEDSQADEGERGGLAATNSAAKSAVGDEEAGLSAAEGRDVGEYRVGAGDVNAAK